jgi:hypothetical protein
MQDQKMRLLPNWRRNQKTRLVAGAPLHFSQGLKRGRLAAPAGGFQGVLLRSQVGKVKYRHVLGAFEGRQQGRPLRPTTAKSLRMSLTSVGAA